MPAETSPLAGLVRTLRARTALTARDEAAILALPYVLRVFEPAAYLVREGEPPRRSCGLLLSGFAFRQKLTANGARQIMSINIAGDLLDMQHLFLDCADHNVQALTRVEVAEIARPALQAIATERPNVGRAMWSESLVEASIFREWILNVGRRDARARVAHLLCELALRMEAAGLGDRQSCVLPMTQEQIGDAVGLTSVHVNRTLRVLREEGVISHRGREVGFADWERLRDAAEFRPVYLHLGECGDQTT